MPLGPPESRDGNSGRGRAGSEVVVLVLDGWLLVPLAVEAQEPLDGANQWVTPVVRDRQPTLAGEFAQPTVGETGQTDELRGVDGSVVGHGSGLGCLNDQPTNSPT